MKPHPAFFARIVNNRSRNQINNRDISVNRARDAAIARRVESSSIALSSGMAAREEFFSARFKSRG